MFESIAELVNRRGWLIVVGWLAFAGTLAATAPSWNSVTRDDDVSFFPAHYPSVVGQRLLERGFPDDVASSSVVVVAERPDRPLTSEDKDFVLGLARHLRELGREDRSLGVKKVTDHTAVGIGPKLLGRSPDGPGQAVLTLVPLQGTYVSKQARLAVNRLEAEIRRESAKAPAGLNVRITGSAVVGRDGNEAAGESIHATTVVTIVLVMAILLLVYRSPLLALIPLLTIALSVWTSLMGIPLLTTIPGLNFQVINITNVFVIVVLFGAGTDYCLFLIARYREELARGRRGDAALHTAITQVGGALVASAGTVIVGLGMLWFSTFAKISYTGPAIALSLVIALIASLTLAPVLLHWLRGTVFWPFKPPHHVKGHDPEQESLDETPMAGFWTGVADFIARRPAAILGVSLLALAPLAYIGSRTKASYDLLGDLSADQSSVVGSRVIRKYFPDGELGPSYVLIDDPRIDFSKDPGIDAVERVSRKLAALPNVAEVRSVSRPLGKPLGIVADRIDHPKPTPEAKGRPTRSFANFLSRKGFGEALERTILSGGKGYYVSTKARGADRDHITKIDLVFKTSPFAAESLRTLDRARAIVEAEVGRDGILAGARKVGLTGTTTLVNDLRTVTTQDEQRMYLLVTLGVYIILVILLRRPGICLYLIATVILGYLASLGLTDLFFRALHRGPDPWTGLDWKVGFFLFVILVAVGEDYNIFLMARVIEEERKHGPIEGTRRAVAHTGGIISSCGLIMAGTFAAMLTGRLAALVQLGFALGLGVLLDTFIVRPILVPAFVILLHRLRGDEEPEFPEVVVPVNGQAEHRPGRPEPATSLWAGQRRFKDGWH